MRTQDEIIRIEREAYALAWEEFSRSAGLTPDERESGPRLLRSYVHIMVDVGEGNPQKIAKTAMAMLRQYQQALRSRAHLAI
jgi:hypothetical protein